MDMSILTGMTSAEELREERPEYYERLRREGKLEALKTTVPPRLPFVFLALGGAISLLIGLGLLVGIVMGLFT